MSHQMRLTRCHDGVTHPKPGVRTPWTDPDCTGPLRTDSPAQRQYCGVLSAASTDAPTPPRTDLGCLRIRRLGVRIPSGADTFGRRHLRARTFGHAVRDSPDT